MDNINCHLEKQRLSRDWQHGFDKGKSCLANLIEAFEQGRSKVIKI